MPKVPIAFLSVLLGALWVGPAEPAMTDKDKAELRGASPAVRTGCRPRR